MGLTYEGVSSEEGRFNLSQAAGGDTNVEYLFELIGFLVEALFELH